jgi:hypothetical protein
MAIARQEKPVRYLRATIAPADESLLCIFEAASEQLVRERNAHHPGNSLGEVST